MDLPAPPFLCAIWLRLCATDNDFKFLEAIDIVPMVNSASVSASKNLSF
jgi:hypothetical protein